MTAQPRNTSFGLPVNLPEPPAPVLPRARPAQRRQASTRPRQQGGGAYRNAFKRGLDILLVVVSLPVTLPLIALFALMVSFRGGHPFYAQARVGRGGRHFRMWKLRTMEPDAENSLERHLASDPKLRAEWDAHQKLRHDPRITSLGHLLRKSSLDELPQIWNVLRGDMSLVGPRPMMPNQQSLYVGRAYYRLRPGLTGLWQVSARNDSVFAYRAACDSRYDRRLCFWLDLKIILFTFIVVFRGTGQ